MKMSMKLALQLIFVISNVLGQCREGCLRCDVEKDLCLFCDTKAGYQTVRGRCIYAQQKNCAIQNTKGNCMKCNKGYYVDSITLTCLESSRAGAVQNCEDYLVDDRCERCKSGFHLTTKNTCIEISTPIENCLKYATPTMCSVCQPGFLLSIDFLSCKAPPDQSNCSSYSPLKCVDCKTGYKENKNNFLYELLSFGNRKHIMNLEMRLVYDEGVFYSQTYNVCQKLQVPNCAIHNQFNECAKCNPGFFLQLGRCYAYPLERIQDCVRYSAVDVCLECVQGMFLKSPQECVKVDKVAECVQYNPSAEQTVCTECQNTHYLSEPNICSKRTEESTIENCKELKKNDQACLVCEEGFTLTSDHKKCLKSLPNCQTYERSDVNNSSLECSVCNPGYFHNLNSKTCDEGSVEKCRVYYKNSNSCEICENRYYLQGGICKTHEDLVYCKQYQNLQKNSCKVCNDRTVLFQRLNTCLPVQRIEHCDSYLTQTECQKCKDGYELTQDKRCAKIPQSEFCLQKNNGVCVKCLANYVLQNGSCHLPLHHIIRNCDSHNVNGVFDYTSIKCNYCKEFSIPINYKDTFVCHENTYLQNQKQIGLIEGCLQYKRIGNAYQCYSCARGMLLYQNTCIKDKVCPNDSTLRLQVIQQVDSTGDGSFDSFYVDKVNECGQALQNCEIAAPDLNQDLVTISYACTKCRSNSISVVDFSEDRILSRPPLGRERDMLTPLSFTPSRVCEGKTNSNVLGEVKHYVVDKCDLYYKLTGFGFGCLKCHHGFTGMVVDLVHQCERYSDLTTCVRCAPGFYPAHPFRCERVQPKEHCVKYEQEGVNGKCVECQPDFFFNSITQMCQKRTVDLPKCKKYNAQEEKCIECEQDFTLVNDNTNQKCIKKIIGCKDYDFGTEECKMCQHKFYMKEKLCYEGKVTNCARYEFLPGQDIVNKCLHCENTFYLTRDNTCEPQPTIDQCDTYFQEQGYCKKCTVNNLLFLSPKKCVITVFIDKCKEFKSQESCRVCEDGFYPVNYGQRCLPIPADKNCLVWGPLNSTFSRDENNCLKCKTGFLLINKVCRNWFSSVTQYCVQENDLPDGQRINVKCKYCNITDNKALSADLSTNNGVCLENDFLTHFKESLLITNCDSYEFDNTNNLLLCSRCQPEYYLLIDLVTAANSRKSCVTYTECDQKTNGTTEFSYVLERYGAFTANTNVDPSGFYQKVCLIQGNGTVANFAAHASKLKQLPSVTSTILTAGTSNFTFGGYDCPSSLPIKEITTPVKASVGLIYSKESASPFHTLPSVIACQSVNGVLAATGIIKGITNAKGLVDNCEYYMKSGNNYYCASCKHGYRGKVNYDTVDHYINSCEAFSQCTSTKNENTIYTDVQSFSLAAFPHTAFTNSFDLNVLFTGCNLCANVIVAIIQNTGNLLMSYKTADFTTGDLTNGDYNLQCLGETDTFGPATLALPTGCQKAILTINPGDQTNIHFCVQCKSGFYPTRDGTDPAKITACTAVTNTSCAESTIGNVCTKCPANYYFEYDETNNVIKYEQGCIQSNNNENCYATNNSGACKVCTKGYKLVTISGTPKCVKIELGKCDEVSFQSIFHHKQMHLLNMMVPLQKEVCEKCASGMTNVKNLNEMLQKMIDDGTTPDFITFPQICYDTDQIYYDDQKPTVATPYARCNNSYSRYLLNNNTTEIHCRECDATGVITLDGKCVLKSDNQNCLVAQKFGSNFCHQCETTPNKYISVAGVCTLESELDANCRQFQDSSFLTGAVCSICHDFYYLVRKIQDNKQVTECIRYYDIADTLHEQKPIKNCAQFNSDDLDRLYCEKCEENYALLILKGDEVEGKSGYNRTCINVKAELDKINCKEIALNPQQNGQLICTKCDDFTASEQYFLTDKSTKPNPDNSLDNFNTCVTYNRDINCAEYEIDKVLERIYQKVTYQFNYIPRQSSLQCLRCKDTHFMKQDIDQCQTRVNTYNGLCEVFEIYQDFCAKCKVNYFLSSDRLSCLPAPNQTKSMGHLYSCKEMRECNPEVRYDGLHPHLESLVSCHKCKNSSHIPFVAVSGGTSYSQFKQVNQYGLQGDFTTGTYKDFIGGRSVFCQAPEASVFSIDPLKFTFPQNCAVGILNVDSMNDASDSNKLTAVDRSKIAVFCGACLPGYRPVYGMDNTGNPQKVDFMVASCEKIDNCEVSNAFNYCSKCIPGYSFEFINGEVNYQKCIQLPVIAPVNKDCYSYDATNSKCVFCCRGTYLNADGFCERINPPKCEYRNFNYRNIYNKKNLQTGLYLTYRGTGCTQCEKGYSGLFIEKNHWVCTQSVIHKQNQVPVSTQYIKYCRNYYISNNLLKCHVCQTGYIPIESTGICTPLIADLSNCVLAKDASFCKKCEETHVLVNRKCEAKNIPNCDIYFYNEESQKQICSECEQEYYLDANKCFPGQVPNCLRFETSKVCNKCKPGFHNVKRNNGVSYCYPIDKNLNCAEFDSNDFQQAKLTCTKCIHNEFVLNSDLSNFYKTHCLRFFETNNCVKYDIKPAIADSSFQCIQCTDQFYIKNAACQIRLVRPQKCEKYQADADRCLQCEHGFYPNLDGTLCLPYPTGTKGCRIYSNLFTCESCQANKYLQGERCIDLTDDQKIENCLYYVDQFNCEQCTDGYQLKDKKCVEIQAQDCLTYESLTSCATCPPMFGFVETNGVKSCVSQTIANCLEINPVPIADFSQVYRCTKCANNFYPDAEKICQPVPEPILNCVLYDTAETCLKCHSQSALAVDRKSCIANRIVMENLDINCAETQILAEPLCNSCQAGFVFEDGNCVACEVENSKKCYSCDPQNKKKCLMCNPGYMMNSQGECVDVPVKEEDDEKYQPQPVDPEDGTPSFYSILHIAMTLLITLF